MDLRLAQPDDVPAFHDLVQRAYAHYVPRLGVRPAPMDEDHAAQVAAGQVWLLEDGGALAGAVVLVAAEDHLLVDNLAVDPARHGAGLGRRLLDHADAEARRRGLPELRLYTNELMTENRAIYAHLGWTEDGSSAVGPFRRVHFRRATSG
ncbi:MAG: GNAT family N-acetyltransferase [Solirubrobacterales bacterium]|nr:GNAT family N-acetyltransferase [Solirubrobacterales bacterium]